MKHKSGDDSKNGRFTSATLGDLRQKKYILWVILKKSCNEQLSLSTHKIARTYYELAKTIEFYNTANSKEIKIRIQTELLNTVNALLKHTLGRQLCKIISKI